MDTGCRDWFESVNKCKESIHVKQINFIESHCNVLKILLNSGISIIIKKTKHDCSQTLSLGNIVNERDVYNYLNVKAPEQLSPILYGTLCDDLKFVATDSISPISDIVLPAGSMVLEYLDNCLLDILLEESDIKPETEGWFENRLRMCRAIIKTARAIIQLGYVHRDLKADNIFMSRSGDGSYIAKVIDFEYTVHDKEVGSNISPKGGFAGKKLPFVPYAGTPRYMPPENKLRHVTYCESYDIYILCALLVIVLGGDIYMDDVDVQQSSFLPDHAALRHEIDARKLYIPNYIPSELQTILIKGLADTPGDRPEMNTIFYIFNKNYTIQAGYD